MHVTRMYAIMASRTWHRLLYTRGHLFQTTRAYQAAPGLCMVRGRIKRIPRTRDRRGHALMSCENETLVRVSLVSARTWHRLLYTRGHLFQTTRAHQAAPGLFMVRGRIKRIPRTRDRRGHALMSCENETLVSAKMLCS